MKKRLASLIMALALCLTFLPATARADESYDLWVGGVRANSANCSNIIAGSSYTGTASYNNNTRTLTLDGVDLSGYNGKYAIQSTASLTIELKENSNNTLAALHGLTGVMESSVIAVGGDLTITGSDSLTLNCTNTTGANNDTIGIECGALTIDGGAKVTVNCGSAENGTVYGVKCNALTVSGANTELKVVTAAEGGVTTGASYYGINATGAVNISGAAVDVSADIESPANFSAGIYATGAVNISNSKVTAKGGKMDGITSGGSESCGIFAASVSISGSSVVEATGKSVTCAEVDSGTNMLRSAGILANTGSVSISDSAKVTAEGGAVSTGNGEFDSVQSYGIYANSEGVSISGATVNVTTGVVNETGGSEGIHCKVGDLTINGGATVDVTAGDANIASYMVRGIYCGAGSLTIDGKKTQVKVIAGKSTGGTIGICSTRDAAIKGGAKVDVTAGASDNDSLGINCGSTLTVSGADTEVEVTAGNATGENGSCGILTGGNISISDDSVKKVEAKGDVALKFVNDSMTLTLTTALPGKGYSKNDATAVNIAAKTYKGGELSDYAHIIFAAESKPEPKPTPTPEREQREPFKQEFQSPLTFNGGKIVVSPESAGIRDTVTLTTVPDAGMELKELSVNMKGVATTGNVKLTDKGNGVYTFQQPGGNAEINAVFGEVTAQSAAIDEPEQVQTEQQQTAAEEVNAQLSRQTITVNGRALDVKAYNIDGHNYVMLRDLAAMLAGTPAKFTVGFDERENKVTIEKGVDYDGALSSDPRDLSRSAMRSRQVVCCDGNVLEGLNVFNIGGNNFFSLRELAEFIGYGITYDEASDTAIIKA